MGEDINLTNAFEKLKKDHLDLQNYLKQQMINSGLLLKAITDSCDREMVKKITNRHFELMKENDLNHQLWQ